MQRHLLESKTATEEARVDILKVRREADLAREDLEREQARHRETKDLLKTCEEKCTHLYQELLSSNKNGVDRWTELQRKNEEQQALLSRQLQLNEDL